MSITKEAHIPEPIIYNYKYKLFINPNDSGLKGLVILDDSAIFKKLKKKTMYLIYLNINIKIKLKIFLVKHEFKYKKRKNYPSEEISELKIWLELNKNEIIDLYSGVITSKQFIKEMKRV